MGQASHKRHLLAAAMVAGVSCGAQAQLTQNLTIHPKALALGNAVTADPPGLMAIHYNPAGLTKLDGRQLEVNLLSIYLDIDADFYADEDYEIFGISGLEKDPLTGNQRDPIANSSSHTNNVAIYVPGYGILRMPPGPAFAPSAGISIKPPGSKLTFANAFYLPMAAGFYRDKNDPGRYLPQAATLQRTTYLSPTVGYEINDEWSVGAGIHLSHFAFAADQYMRAPNLLMGVAEVLQDAFNCESGDEPLQPWLALCGGNVGPWDDIGAMSLNLQETISPTYALGVMWEPTDWFRWGASYTSEADMNLKGQFEIQYTDDWSGFWQSVNGSILGAISSAILSLPSGAPREAGNVSMDLVYPQHFQTGISVDVHPKLTVNADVGWTDFAQWDAFNFQFDRNLEFLNAARILSPDNATSDTLRLPLGFKSQWNWAFGVEFHASSRLDLRAGVEIRDSVIPDDQRSIMAPFGGANLYSIGMGYKWDKDTEIDMNLSYLQSIETIPADTSCNVNCDNITNIIYNPYADLTIKTSLRVVMAGLSFRTKF
ncbi:MULTISPECIES: OmpP1/FadL family transporter [Marinobacter]|jgi:long-subunit fatty acid transport protein|uniref:Long-chain fatty acid transport protein n=2 Tax=Marinobacter nauticus TaxID=2743 RepID=A0A833N6Y0_MARNT|nr:MULTISPECIES: outer membrane protein transport protein [Marinobacter]KAE8544341.1 Long-chain fatty acid transport protein [Marinobacter nauticus]MAC21942.1 aromatic hydrocarbon degradation protein [Marinobacter sp.]MAL32627.1 aromatic hydrocarbon degradation protein [Marinobacter sp.]HCL39070.1 aromatic hydrocarbon degradation protein [Marinobacter nauticus]HCR45443.1 aromatic hydrocarbon degradation protein [Marinobacter nauticus]|tara:strand:+ start:859 stop:2484 length:1626 start_codon:yes stop_codon:yes gene_type:complete